MLKTAFRPLVDLPAEMRKLMAESQGVVEESRLNVEASHRVADSDGLADALDGIAREAGKR